LYIARSECGTSYVTMYICTHIHTILLVHLVHILSYNRFIASSKWVLHTMQSSASSYNLQYRHIFLRLSNSCLCLLLCFPVTSTLPSVVPSITCCRGQFLHKMRLIQLASICLLYVDHSLPPPTLQHLFMRCDYTVGRVDHQWQSRFVRETYKGETKT
jgi:hypothetical protein